MVSESFLMVVCTRQSSSAVAACCLMLLHAIYMQRWNVAGLYSGFLPVWMGCCVLTCGSCEHTRCCMH